MSDSLHERRAAISMCSLVSGTSRQAAATMAARKCSSCVASVSASSSSSTSVSTRKWGDDHSVQCGPPFSGQAGRCAQPAYPDTPARRPLKELKGFARVPCRARFQS